jgi:hypothetical protein
MMERARFVYSLRAGNRGLLTVLVAEDRLAVVVP